MSDREGFDAVAWKWYLRSPRARDAGRPDRRAAEICSAIGTRKRRGEPAAGGFSSAGDDGGVGTADGGGLERN